MDMKKIFAATVLLLWIMLLLSCGAAKRSLQEKAASVLEEQAREMGLDVEIDADALKDGIAEGLTGEALEEILEPGVEALSEQLEGAFSDEVLEEMAESMGALDAAFERDADGNITNIHLEDEDGVFDMNGSTEWPDDLPSRIPRYEDGMLFLTQREEGESITLAFGNNSLDYAKEYTLKLKKNFNTVLESEEGGWVFVGTSNSDGVVLAYNDGGVVLQYYMSTEFAESWQQP